ncbi:MAG: class I SAM-dependent methyltransferase [Porphyrobacter sp.]|nr:class I SAM-dependent methyltransferase [Porphyrobacter sp.]
MQANGDKSGTDKSGGVTFGGDEWQGRTGDSWAAEWKRTDRSFGMLTERLLQRSRDFTSEAVLDIGCGAGELSLALARTQPGSRVTGIDISPQLLNIAKDRARNLSNVRFELADAAAWDSGESLAPDLLVSRHGVMFFDDPVAAFAHLGGIAAPNAGLLFSCFRTWEENPVFRSVTRLLPIEVPPPAPGAPGPFAFSDRTYVQGILTAAGWRDIAFEPYDFAMVVGAGPDPVEDAASYFTVIGGAARAARELAPEARESFINRVRDLARANLREGIVSLRAGAWIVTAHR